MSSILQWLDAPIALPRFILGILAMIFLGIWALLIADPRRK
jgi:hypothetical protein